MTVGFRIRVKSHCICANWAKLFWVIAVELSTNYFNSLLCHILDGNHLIGFSECFISIFIIFPQCNRFSKNHPGLKCRTITSFIIIFVFLLKSEFTIFIFILYLLNWIYYFNLLLLTCLLNLINYLWNQYCYSQLSLCYDDINI